VIALLLGWAFHYAADDGVCGGVGFFVAATPPFFALSIAHSPASLFALYLHNT
jgi:hypothetical protein